MKVVKKWIDRIHPQSRFEAMGWVSSFPSFLALPKVTLLSELRFPRATQVETTGDGSLVIYLASLRSKRFQSSYPSPSPYPVIHFFFFALAPAF